MPSVTFTCPRCGTVNTDQRACEGAECTYALTERQWHTLQRKDALRRFIPRGTRLDDGVRGRSGVRWLVMATLLMLAPFIPGAPGAVPALTEESWRQVNSQCTSCDGSVLSATALQVHPTGIMEFGGAWTTADRVYLTVESPDPSGVRVAARAGDEAPQVGRIEKSGRVWFSRFDEAGHLGRFAGTFALNDRVTITSEQASDFDQWSAGPLRGLPVHRIASPLSAVPFAAIVVAGAIVAVREFRRTTVLRFYDRVALTLVVVTGTLTAGWIGPNISRTLGRSVSLTTYSTGVGMSLLALYLAAMIGAPTTAFLVGRRIDDRVPLSSLHPTVIRCVSAALSVVLLVAGMQLLDQAIASTFLGFEF